MFSLSESPPLAGPASVHPPPKFLLQKLQHLFPCNFVKFTWIRIEAAFMDLLTQSTRVLNGCVAVRQRSRNDRLPTYGAAYKVIPTGASTSTRQPRHHTPPTRVLPIHPSPAEYIPRGSPKVPIFFSLPSLKAVSQPTASSAITNMTAT